MSTYRLGKVTGNNIVDNVLSSSTNAISNAAAKTALDLKQDSMTIYN